jgi:hypothetical protein
VNSSEDTPIISDAVESPVETSKAKTDFVAAMLPHFSTGPATENVHHTAAEVWPHGYTTAASFIKPSETEAEMHTTPVLRDVQEPEADVSDATLLSASMDTNTDSEGDSDQDAVSVSSETPINAEMFAQPTEGSQENEALPSTAQPETEFVAAMLPMFSNQLANGEPRHPAALVWPQSRLASVQPTTVQVDANDQVGEEDDVEPVEFKDVTQEAVQEDASEDLLQDFHGHDYEEDKEKTDADISKGACNVQEAQNEASAGNYDDVCNDTSSHTAAVAEVSQPEVELVASMLPALNTELATGLLHQPSQPVWPHVHHASSAIDASNGQPLTHPGNSLEQEELRSAEVATETYRALKFPVTDDNEAFPDSDDSDEDDDYIPDDDDSNDDGPYEYDSDDDDSGGDDLNSDESDDQDSDGDEISSSHKDLVVVPKDPCPDTITTDASSTKDNPQADASSKPTSAVSGESKETEPAPDKAGEVVEKPNLDDQDLQPTDATTGNEGHGSPFLRLDPVINAPYIPQCMREGSGIVQAAKSLSATLPAGFLRLTPEVRHAFCLPRSVSVQNTKSTVMDEVFQNRSTQKTGPTVVDQVSTTPPTSGTAVDEPVVDSPLLEQVRKMIRQEIKDMFGQQQQPAVRSMPFVFTLSGIIRDELNGPQRLTNGTVRSPALSSAGHKSPTASETGVKETQEITVDPRNHSQPADANKESQKMLTASHNPDQAPQAQTTQHSTNSNPAVHASHLYLGTISLADFFEALQTTGGNTGFWTRQELATAFLSLSNRERSTLGVPIHGMPEYVEQVLASKSLLKMVNVGTCKLGAFLELMEFDSQGAASGKGICRAFRVAAERDAELQRRLAPFLKGL